MKQNDVDYVSAAYFDARRGEELSEVLWILVDESFPCVHRECRDGCKLLGHLIQHPGYGAPKVTLTQCTRCLERKPPEKRMEDGPDQTIHS